jgi:ribose-phosphate pyrophosphokinase
MIQAAKLGSAKRITAVMPLYPYARQDRKAKPREPISARFIADALQVAGADRILTMDLHAGQIQGFFSIPVDHMTALPLFARHFRDLGLHGEGVISVSPDAGRAKQAVRFAEMMEAEFAIMHKSRPSHDMAAVTEIAGRVKGKRAILGDDVIMTGGTMMANVRALEEHGASEVWLFATHGLFCGDALDSFVNSDAIKGIVVTDTVPIDPISKPEKLTVLPVSGLLAETIMNVCADDSVSAIFGGENQLFSRGGTRGSPASPLLLRSARMSRTCPPAGQSPAPAAIALWRNHARARHCVCDRGSCSCRNTHCETRSCCHLRITPFRCRNFQRMRIECPERAAGLARSVSGMPPHRWVCSRVRCDASSGCAQAVRFHCCVESRSTTARAHHHDLAE